MLPSGHTDKKPGDIWAVLPRLNLIHQQGRKLNGWLIDKFGRLMAVYVNCRVLFPYTPPLAPASCSGLDVPSYAGGLREEGAARLKGVLNYFTRGPNKRGTGTHLLFRVTEERGHT